MIYHELRQLLYDNLSDLLGTYTDGSPAIADLPNGRPRSGVMATGLEVVIQTDPEDRGLPMHHRARSHVDEWQVRVLHHGHGSLYEARKRILELFPDASSVTIAVNDPTIPSQILIRIPT